MPLRGRYSPFDLTAFNQRLDHGLLLGLGDDDHDYIKESEFTQDSGVLVGTGSGAFTEETGATLRTSLGLGIGTDVQAFDAVLDDISALSVVADNEFIVGTGAGTYAHENPATARTSLGLGTGDSPTFNDLIIGDGRYIGSVSDTDAIQIEADGDVVMTQKLGLGVSPAQKFEIGSNDNSDRISIYHDNSNAYMKWNDGVLRFQTDEGTNTITYLDIRGKGTGKAILRLNAYSLFMASSGPIFDFIPLAQGDARFFSGSDEGQTQKLQIYGRRTGDSLRNLQIGVGVDAADTASFDGLSNYYFDGNIGVKEIAPETLLEMTGAQPYLTLHNNTHEDSDGGRESRLIFKGEQSGGEETTLAQIEVSHDGSADDQLGKMVFSVNTGAGLAEGLRIDSSQNATFAGNVSLGTGELTAGSINRASGTLTLEVAGTPRLSLAAKATFSGSILGIDGAKEEPTYAFTYNTDTGMYYDPSIVAIYFSIDSVRVFSIEEDKIRIKDEASAFYGGIQFSGQAMSEDRQLTLNLDDTNRTITFSGNPTLADWFDQSVKIASLPVFAGLTLEGQLTLAGNARVIRHLHFVPELGRGQSAPTIRYTEDPYASYTYAINDDSHMTREVPQDMDYTVESIIKIHWYTTDPTAVGTDEVRWEAQWASRAPGEDITTGDTTDNSGDIVCSAANIIIETAIETIPADSIVEGDMLGIHIERVILGDGTNPTAGTVHVLDVELEYTSNKLGLAL